MAVQKEKFLYKKLYDYLFEMVKNNYAFKNYQLPSEAKLAELHSVSRITAKAAIQQLEREGLVFRVQGKGTFIANITQADIDRVEAMNTPALPTETARCVGLILPDFRSKYVMDILESIQNTLAKEDINLLVGASNYSQEEEKRLILSFMSNKISGLIIYPADGETYNNEILKLSMRNFPLVFIDRNLSGIKASYVHSDNYLAAYELTSYLITNGHKNIGIVSSDPTNVATIEERISGHNDALSDHGLIINKKHVLNELKNYDPDWESKIGEFIRTNNDLTAVIALNYDISIKIYTVLEKLNIAIPDRLSVVSYDDLLKNEIELIRIKPTCVRQFPLEIGERAARAVLNILQKKQWDPEEIRIRQEVIYRDSVKKIGD